MGSWYRIHRCRNSTAMYSSRATGSKTPCTATTYWQRFRDRKSTRLNSSHGYISYAVFCLKKKQANLRPERLDIWFKDYPLNPAINALFHQDLCSAHLYILSLGTTTHITFSGSCDPHHTNA